MKRKYIYATFGVALSFFKMAYGWSWLYDIKLHEYTHKRAQDVWEATKIGIPKFSQLLFSWNALRSKGHFSFWVQARDSATKKWYAWHQAARWGTDGKGNNIQQSLQSKSKWGTRYLYVRLELPRLCFADGFRIRIKAHNGAPLNAVKRIAVNTVNLKKFNSELQSNQLAQLPSIYISNVPALSQRVLNHPRTQVLCSPTSTTMLLSYLLKKKVDPHATVRGVYDHGLGVYGSWPFNIAHAFEVCKGKVSFHVERLSSFRELHRQLSRGMPVVVSVRGYLKGAPITYDKGHLLVVVGYSKKFKKIVCQDPAFERNEKTTVAYDLKNFLTAWERSYRLAYIATYA